MFDRSFLGMMPQTVTWEPYSSMSSDGYGTITYSTGKSVRCRIQQGRRLVPALTGREVESQATLYLAPWTTAGTSDSVVVNLSDRITLPSGFVVAGSTAPPIVAVSRNQDEAGDHHVVVHLGAARMRA